jgi:hypothetical protein
LAHTKKKKDQVLLVLELPEVAEVREALVGHVSLHRRLALELRAIPAPRAIEAADRAEARVGRLVDVLDKLQDASGVPDLRPRLSS